MHSGGKKKGKYKKINKESRKKKYQKLTAWDDGKEETSMLEFMYALPWVGPSRGKHLLLVVA